MTLCECGCGQLAPIAKRTSTFHGWKKGQPKRFISGHNNRGKKFSDEHKQKIAEANKITKKDWWQTRTHPTKGKPLTKEHRDKLSKILSGKALTKEHVKKITEANRGQKRSIETKARMSMAQKGRKLTGKHLENLRKACKKRIGKYAGPNCVHWKGGISLLPYCPEFTRDFKEFIKERDDNECQNPLCLGINDRMCVHHIDYDKQNCRTENLVTLCWSCNSRANFERQKWQSMFLDLPTYKNVQ